MHCSSWPVKAEIEIGDCKEVKMEGFNAHFAILYITVCIYIFYFWWMHLLFHELTLGQLKNLRFWQLRHWEIITLVFRSLHLLIQAFSSVHFIVFAPFSCLKSLCLMVGLSCVALIGLLSRIWLQFAATTLSNLLMRLFKKRCWWYWCWWHINSQ